MESEDDEERSARGANGPERCTMGIVVVFVKVVDAGELVAVAADVVADASELGKDVAGSRGKGRKKSESIF